MMRIENECCDCGLPCTGYCPYLNVHRMYCDHCGEEIFPGEGYLDDRHEYCRDCYLETLLYDPETDCYLYEDEWMDRTDIPREDPWDKYFF